MKVKKLAQQEKVGRGIADTDLGRRLGCIVHSFALCETTSEKCSEDFAGGREKNGRCLDPQRKVRAIICDKQNITDVADDFRERFNFWILCVRKVVSRKVEICHGCRG